MPLAGGYAPVPDFEEDSLVVEAAAFAFGELRSPGANAVGESVSGFRIVRASQQVVAGMNIRMTLLFHDALGKCAGACTVVVYNHFGDLSVTQWATDDSVCENPQDQL